MPCDRCREVPAEHNIWTTAGLVCQLCAKALGVVCPGCAHTRGKAAAALEPIAA